MINPNPNTGIKTQPKLLQSDLGRCGVTTTPKWSDKPGLRTHPSRRLCNKKDTHQIFVNKHVDRDQITNSYPSGQIININYKIIQNFKNIFSSTC